MRWKKTILTSLLPEFQNILDQTQQTTTVVVIMLLLEKAEIYTNVYGDAMT